MYKNFEDFLKSVKIEKGDECEITHTSFGPPYGSYNISDDKLDKFLSIYKRVINTSNPLHIVERPKYVGPLVIDLDFRLAKENSKRQYDEVFVCGIVSQFTTVLKKHFPNHHDKLTAFVFEKDKPTYDDKAKNYKDGIHIMYPELPMSAAMRYYVLETVKDDVESLDLFSMIEYINSIDDVFDMSVVMRNGWMMYGSKKHNGNPYKLSYIYNHKIRKQKNNYSEGELVVLLSQRQYDPEDEITPVKVNASTLEKIYGKYHKTKKEKQQKEQKEYTQSTVQQSKKEYSNKQIEIAKQLVDILSDNRANRYYEWICVGWCLYNISQTLLPTFKNFSKRCPSKYKESECDKVWSEARDDGLTIASLYKWAKDDNPEGFANVIRGHIQQNLMDALSATHDDVASLLVELYGHEFKCVSISKNKWYQFRDHRWHLVDSAFSLSLYMGDEVVKEYSHLMSALTHKLGSEISGYEKDIVNKQIALSTDIVKKLKNTSFKGQVIRACSHKMYDADFESKLDSNHNLIGFDNGVYDLENNTFRPGLPDDMLTLSVGYDFVEYTLESEQVKNVIQYFKTVQQEVDMREYILTLISTYIDGHNKQQKFILWTGSGCHARDTEIIMHDNSIKKVQNIQLGELIMGDDGTSRRVLQQFEGEMDLYRITMGDIQFVVNRLHRLALMYTSYPGEFTIDMSNPHLEYQFVWHEYINGSIILMKRSFTNPIDGYDMLINNKNALKHGDIIPMTVESYLKLDDSIKSIFSGYTSTNKKFKVKVEYEKYGRFYGFELDGNQRYVMGNTVITYNSNGKSTTVDLMKHAFGAYFGVLPVTVLTKKRTSSSNATPELADKRGKRCVVIQEPEHDDTIYVGYMKELTGSDWITTRALYGDPFEYKPQFKLLLTCNKLPNIPSNDGGTWRRLRVSPWETEFVDGKPQAPHQHPKDPSLMEKLEEWKSAFMWLLITEYYPKYKSNGLKEPLKVTQYTDKYKKDNDIYFEFLTESCEVTGDEKDIEMADGTYNVFKEWYKSSRGTSVIPPKKELLTYLDANTKCKVKGQKILGIKIKSYEVNDDACML